MFLYISVNALGGKLTHHIDNHSLEGIYNTHPIVIRKDVVAGIFDSDYMNVNSRHHQGYMLKSYNQSLNNEFLLEFKPIAFSIPNSLVKEKATKQDKDNLANLLEVLSKDDINKNIFQDL